MLMKHGRGCISLSHLCCFVYPLTMKSPQLDKSPKRSTSTVYLLVKTKHFLFDPIAIQCCRSFSARLYLTGLRNCFQMVFSILLFGKNFSESGLHLVFYFVMLVPRENHHHHHYHRSRLQRRTSTCRQNLLLSW